MNAEQARDLALSNFDKIKNDKISRIMEMIQASAENGEFEIIVKQTSLNPTEIRHLQELGYDVKYIFPDDKLCYHGGKQVMIIATDLSIKWY